MSKLLWRVPGDFLISNWYFQKHSRKLLSNLTVNEILEIKVACINREELWRFDLCSVFVVCIGNGVEARVKVMFWMTERLKKLKVALCPGWNHKVIYLFIKVIYEGKSVQKFIQLLWFKLFQRQLKRTVNKVNMIYQIPW